MNPLGDRQRTLRLPGLLAVLLLCLASSVHAEVQLQLDRSRVTEGETVTLSFLTDDEKQRLDPDLSVLEEDFEVLGSRSETQVSIVNGRQTAVVRLLVTVEPRRSGRITIPPIEVGGSRTQPVALQVDPAPELAPGELPPVFLEVEIAPEQGPYYVHAQLGLVVRVFYQSNLTEAAISPPEPSAASVRLLQETPYKADRGGQRYNVLERRYAIFPERSGEMVVPAMELSGRLAERRSSGLWQPSARGRRVSVESEPIRLQIEPRPDAFTGTHWQPARDYNLSQQISGTEALRVGEPVTRTVIIDAVGLEENMIAEPEWPDLPGTRIYPDQPQGISRDDGEWVLGHKEFRYAVVPEHEGEMVLPALTVHWWDTEEDRQRTATLPAKAIRVQPSALVAPPAPADLPARGAQPAPQSAAANGAAAYWRWLALLFAVLWLVTLAAALFLRPPLARRPTPARGAAVPAGETEALAALRDACKRGDAAGARHALQAWLRDFGPSGSPSLLEFAAGAASPELARRIYELDALGYRVGAAESWDGKASWAAFEAWRRDRQDAGHAQKPSPTDLYAPANRAG